MTGGPAPGCGCDPPWPSLVVHTEAGDVAVEPAATPSGLACLYQAYCSRCEVAYPGPFRVPPAARHRAGPPRPAQAGPAAGQRADAA